jgi:hypothetical protein
LNFDLGFRSITVPIGVAQLHKSLSETIACADVALYVAKNSGRNCVIADSSSALQESQCPDAGSAAAGQQRIRA